jgi:predicted  nucleic acid-binding Zn-ribbon protein
MTRWDTLLVVQDHDTHIDQLVHRSETLPLRATLAELEERIAGVDAQIAEVDGRLGDLGRSQQRLEDEIASLRDKQSQADKQLYSGTTNNPRELQALQDDIDSIKRRISKLEDDELEVMEATEPVDAERKALAAQRADLDGQAQTLRGELDAAVAEIDAELAEERARRDVAAADVDGDLLTEYEGLRKRSGGIAIARLVGSTCQGCHLGLSAVEVDRIRKLSLDERVTCEECGRLLVRS